MRDHEVVVAVDDDVVLVDVAVVDVAVVDVAFGASVLAEQAFVDDASAVVEQEHYIAHVASAHFVEALADTAKILRSQK